MKFFLLFFLAAAFVVACARETPEVLPANASASDKATVHSTQNSSSVKAATVTKALSATGRAADEKPVALKIQAADQSVTGTLTVDSHTLAVQGTLDNGVLRCWLNSTDGSTFRGNLIGTIADDAIKAEFIISNSAGEKVIRGNLGDQVEPATGVTVPSPTPGL